MADRIKAVFLLGSGRTVSDMSEATAAEVLMMDEKTVRGHFQTWESGGIDALKHRLYRGRVASLTQEQKKELSTWLDKNLCLNVSVILRHVEKTYGVILSRSHMCGLLHSLGFVYKKPKHVPGKADVEKQKNFAAEYRQLLENAGENEVFYFGDRCHPQHNHIPAYGWIRRGVERELKSNCSRQHVNINGVINIDTLATYVTFPKTINAQTTVKLFKKRISRHHSKTIIHVFVANTKYYHSKLLREFLNQTKFAFIFYPPIHRTSIPSSTYGNFSRKKYSIIAIFLNFPTFPGVPKLFSPPKTVLPQTTHARHCAFNLK
ncbi:MAG: IS630 family transposase [Planctomycetia bacterium]|nr:IS630 family transposase [Planctomycetia bacterium]